MTDVSESIQRRDQNFMKMTDISELMRDSYSVNYFDLRRHLETFGITREEFDQYESKEIGPNDTLGEYIREYRLLDKGRWVSKEENGTEQERFYID